MGVTDMMNQYLKAFLILTIFAAVLATFLYIFHIVHQEFRDVKKEYIKAEKTKAIAGALFPVGGIINRNP